MTLARDVQHASVIIPLKGHVPEAIILASKVVQTSDQPVATSANSVKGRVRCSSSVDGDIYSLVLAAGSHRLCGASIAGLVVGAMGVFVFAAALRHWIERPRMLD